MLVLYALLIGIPILACLKYIAYTIFANGIPGWVIYSLAVKEKRSNIITLVHSWIVGICLDATVVMLCMKFDVLEYSMFWPIVFYSIAFIFWSCGFKIKPPKTVYSYSLVETVVLLLAFVSLAGLVMLYTARYPLDPHYHWMGSHSMAMLHGWPLKDPYAFGTNLYTHYLYNGYLLNAGRVVGLMPFELSFSLAPMLQLVGLMTVLYDVCGKQLKGGYFAILAVAVCFAQYGFDTEMWRWYHSSTTTIILRVQSIIMGMSFLYLLLTVTRAIVRSNRGIRDLPSILFLTYLFFIAPGVRIQVLAWFIFATGILVFVLFGRLFLLRSDSKLESWRLRRKLVSQLATAFGIAGVAIMALKTGLWFFFGSGQEGDPAGHLTIGMLDPSITHVGYGFIGSYEYFATAVGDNKITLAFWLLIILMGRLSILLPGVVLYVVRLLHERKMSTLEVLVAGVFLSGLVSIVGLKGNLLNENWAFYFASDYALAVLAGVGFAWLFRQQQWYYAKTAVVVTMLIFAPLHIYDITMAIYRDEPISERLNYVEENRSSDFRKLADWIDAETPPNRVLLTKGDRVDEFDERRFSSSIEDMQLYGRRSVMRVLEQRGDAMPDKFRWRLNAVFRPFTESYLDFVLDDIGPDRSLIILVVGDEDPPCIGRLKLVHSVKLNGDLPIRVYLPDTKVEADPFVDFESLDDSPLTEDGAESQENQSIEDL